MSNILKSNASTIVDIAKKKANESILIYYYRFEDGIIKFNNCYINDDKLIFAGEETTVELIKSANYNVEYDKESRQITISLDKSLWLQIDNIEVDDIKKIIESNTFCNDDDDDFDYENFDVNHYNTIKIGNSLSDDEESDHYLDDIAQNTLLCKMNKMFDGIFLKDIPEIVYSGSFIERYEAESVIERIFSDKEGFITNNKGKEQILTILMNETRITANNMKLDRCVEYGDISAEFSNMDLQTKFGNEGSDYIKKPFYDYVDYKVVYYEKDQQISISIDSDFIIDLFNIDKDEYEKFRDIRKTIELEADIKSKKYE